MRAAFCKSNPLHKEFQRKQSKCNCGAPLLATCARCGSPVAYGYVAGHEKKCQKKQRVEDPRVVRFAYLASDWKLNPDKKSNEAFLVPPRGQLWDIPHGFAPAAGETHLRVHRVKDPSMRGVEWMDTYDGLFAKVAANDQFELVKVFQSWDEVKRALRQWKEKVDVLVLGNWIMKVMEEEGDPSEWLERLRWFELENQCRVFPPLDYAVHFSRKELYYHETSRVLSHGVVRCIPTMFISPSVSSWKATVRAFASKHKVQRVVFKRSLSECKKHVVVQEVAGLKAPFDKGPAWLVQPFITDFQERNEVRLYVLNGKFAFGAETRFEEEGVAAAAARVFPFSRDDDSAIQAAEAVVRAVALSQADAGRFMRVDMIWCEADQVWLLNELEFFGNAYIHTEVLQDAYEVLPVLVECVEDWMRSV